MSGAWYPIDERLVQKHLIPKLPSTDDETFAIFEQFHLLGDFLKMLYLVYRSDGYKLSTHDAYIKVMLEYAQMAEKKGEQQ